MQQPKELGFWMCTALVVGNTIGMGIFVLPASLAPYGLNAMLGWGVTVLGMTMLAGIGFTMSLFIGNLAFGTGDLATPVRFGVLGGSFASAIAGLIVLWLFTRGEQAAPSALTQEEEIAEQRGVLENIDAPPKSKR